VLEFLTVVRVFAAVVFIGTLVQATGLSVAAVRDCGGCGVGANTSGTSDGCQGEEESGDCAPDCERCLCCAHHRVVALPPLLDSRLAVSQALPPITAPAPDLSSDPGEILDVPKRSDSAS
jgi:hypothetical protein